MTHYDRVLAEHESQLRQEENAPDGGLRPAWESLVLVGEIQRSGGTLLSRLLDGHPEIHSYPLELTWGSTAYDWPEVDLAASEAVIFEELAAGSANHVGVFAAEGYIKPRRAEGDRRRFDMNLARHRDIFIEMLDRRSRRTVLDTFLVSFFMSWTNRIQGSPHRPWVTAFGKRHNLQPARTEFWHDYPDGVLITIVRDPAAWFASASRHRPRTYPDVPSAMAQWEASCRASLEAAEQGALLLTFEQLVGDTAATMSRVCSRLSIQWHDSLLAPSFNGAPIQSNSTYEPTDSVDAGALARSSRLDDDTRRLVTRAWGELYAVAASVASVTT